MSLNINKVYHLLGQVLGTNAIVVQNFITSIENVPGIVGTFITGNGTLCYDPEWWEKNIDSPEKARHAVVFEVIKKLLNADEGADDWIRKVAVGSVINSYLNNVLGYQELPRAMYSAKNLPECLMRPGARGFHSRLKYLYKMIWDRTTVMTSISNVENALRILFQDDSLIPEDFDENDLEVLGFGHPDMDGDGNEEGEGDGSRTHGVEGTGKFVRLKSEQLPPNVLEQMSKGIQEAEQNSESSKSAGYSETVVDYVTQRIVTRKTLETKLIEDFAMDNIKKSVKKYFDGEKEDITVIPKRLSKMDAIKLALDIPVFWFTNTEDSYSHKGGVAVYVDVSGSFYRYIPYVFGLVESMQDYIEKLYQFSNYVHESTLQEIMQKKVDVVGTGGTDFDCIMEHAIENGFDKVLIITDGWGDVNKKELRKKTSESIKNVMVILCLSYPNNVPNHRTMLKNKESFINSTWLGKTYGVVHDLSEVFK